MSHIKQGIFSTTVLTTKEHLFLHEEARRTNYDTEITVNSKPKMNKKRHTFDFAHLLVLLHILHI